MLRQCGSPTGRRIGFPADHIHHKPEDTGRVRSGSAAVRIHHKPEDTRQIHHKPGSGPGMV